MGKMIFTVLGSVGELERSLVRRAGEMRNAKCPRERKTDWTSTFAEVLENGDGPNPFGTEEEGKHSAIGDSAQHDAVHH